MKNIRRGLGTLLAILAVLAVLPSTAQAAGPGCDNLSGRVNQQQIECVARLAGWNHEDAVIASAIAEAESAGKTHATSFDGGHGKGLFQIDDRYWKIGRHCAFQAICNTFYAHNHVWRSGGWHQWATYNNKSYCKFLSRNFKKRHQRRCL